MSKDRIHKTDNKVRFINDKLKISKKKTPNEDLRAPSRIEDAFYRELCHMSNHRITQCHKTLNEHKDDIPWRRIVIYC